VTVGIADEMEAIRAEVRAAIPWPKPATMYHDNGPTKPTLLEVRGHTFEILPTKEAGFHSGRRRYLVECATCGVTVHEATTGPAENMVMHLERVSEGRHGTL